MNITWTLAPLVSLIAGVLILIMPRLLNYIVHRRGISDHFRMAGIVPGYSPLTGLGRGPSAPLAAALVAGCFCG